MLIDTMKSHDDEYREYLDSKPEPEPICQNCKYWSPYMNGENGNCNLSRMRLGMMSSGCGLKTNKAFGCNQFVGGENKSVETVINKGTLYSREYGKLISEDQYKNIVNGDWENEVCEPKFKKQ